MKNKLFYGMAPAILFIFAEELLQTAMEWLWQQAGVYGGTCGQGSGLWNDFLSVLQRIEPGDRQALSIAVAMLGALPWIFGSLQRSIHSWEGISTRGSREERHAGAVAGAGWMLICICLALGINIFILLFTEGKAGDAVSAATLNSPQVGTVFVGLGIQAAKGTEGTGVGSLLLAAVVYGLVSPFAEEAVFRGSLFGNLRRCMPLWQAVLLSSLLFGIYHGNPSQALYAFVMGMAFAAAYARCGRFAVPFFLHGTVNLVILLFSYMGVTAQLASPLWGMTFLLLAMMGILLQYSDNISKHNK